MIQWNGHRVFGVLAMSRSIGKQLLHSLFLILHLHVKKGLIYLSDLSLFPRSPTLDGT